jgi:hypothetical protein
MWMGSPNWSQIIKHRLKAGFIESALLGEVHRPQRAGLEKLRPRNGSPVFIAWVKSRA